jgi:hypothetical protein
LTCRGKAVGLRLDIVAFGMMSKQLGDGEWSKKTENLATFQLILGVPMATTEAIPSEEERSLFKHLTGSKASGI